MSTAEGGKQTTADLAYFGGAPAFEQPLHVGRPNIGDRQKFHELIDDMFDRRWLTNNGPYVQKLEHRIAGLLGVEHVVAVCNATVGLEIAVRALGFTGEVILPSFTFVATAHALDWYGIRPVFCDVDPETHTLDVNKIEELITPRTSAIMPVHVWGQACDVDRISGIAEDHNLKVLYDAAHAFDCSYKGQMIGGFGDAEVFSFHATKFFNTLEGGAITTNDAGLARKLRMMRDFGYDENSDVVMQGTNGKMNEASAAMGLVNLDALDEIIARNYQNYRQYLAELTNVPGVKVFRFNKDEQRNYQYVVVEIDEEVAGINRDNLVKILHAERVLARRYFQPGCHQMEPYIRYDPAAGDRLPVTERLCEQVMSLPTGTAVSVSEIARICQIIRFVLQHGNQITLRMENPER